MEQELKDEIAFHLEKENPKADPGRRPTLNSAPPRATFPSTF